MHGGLACQLVQFPYGFLNVVFSAIHDDAQVVNTRWSHTLLVPHLGYPVQRLCFRPRLRIVIHFFFLFHRIIRHHRSSTIYFFKVKRTLIYRCPICMPPAMQLKRSLNNSSYWFFCRWDQRSRISKLVPTRTPYLRQLFYISPPLSHRRFSSLLGPVHTTETRYIVVVITLEGDDVRLGSWADKVTTFSSLFHFNK